MPGSLKAAFTAPRSFGIAALARESQPGARAPKLPDLITRSLRASLRLPRARWGGGRRRPGLGWTSLHRGGAHSEVRTALARPLSSGRIFDRQVVPRGLKYVLPPKSRLWNLTHESLKHENGRRLLMTAQRLQTGCFDPRLGLPLSTHGYHMNVITGVRRCRGHWGDKGRDNRSLAPQPVS
jgi:hypothetical protein